MSKCKVCGFRLADGAVKCPICGAMPGSTKAGNIAQNVHLPKYFCPSCTAEILGEHRYCPTCGIELNEAAKKANMPEQAGSTCVQCGVPLPEGATFCHVCGAKQAYNCSQCGAMLLPNATFCNKCGIKQNSLPSTRHSVDNAAVLVSGAEDDNVKTLVWYKKAAEAGYAYAMRKIGFFYDQGWGGLKRDKVEALKWYKKAAEAGDAIAMCTIGRFYSKGERGLKEDKAEALKWYKKAAEAGDIAAMCALAISYSEGIGGLKEDKAEALKWYKKAAEVELPRRIFSVGYSYSEDLGKLKKDKEESLMWFITNHGTETI